MVEQYKVPLIGGESKGFRRGKNYPLKQGITFGGRTHIFQSDEAYLSNPFYGERETILKILEGEKHENGLRVALLSKNGEEIIGTVLDAVVNTLETKK